MTLKLAYIEFVTLIHSLERELSEHKKKLNGSLKFNQQYLRTILDNTNFAFFLKSADFKYILMNRQLGHLAKINYKQVKGKDDYDFFPESVAKLFRSQDEKVFRRKTLIEFKETLCLHDSAQSFMIAKFPLIDSKGDVYALGGVCINVTAHDQIEAKLKKAEEKYRDIVEHSPLGIVHLDSKGVVTACNDKLAHIFGLKVEHIKGINSLKFIKNEEIKAAITKVLSGRISYYEGSYRPVKTGESVYIRIVFSPIFSNDGEVTGATCIIENITDHKNAARALQKAHAELEKQVADSTTQLEKQSQKLKEANIALKFLLEKREEDKKEFEKKMMFNISKLICPYLEQLKEERNEDSRKTLIELIQSNLDRKTSSFAYNHQSYLSKLTPSQIQIADMIKQGKSTKEIASLLNLSPLTISRHRQEIRKKLSLANNKINLREALSKIT